MVFSLGSSVSVPCTISMAAVELAKSLLESGQLRFKGLCVERRILGFSVGVEIRFEYSGLELKAESEISDELVRFTTFGLLINDLLPILLANRGGIVMTPPVLAELLEVNFFEKYGVELKEVLIGAIARRLLEISDAKRCHSLNISNWDRVRVIVESITPEEEDRD